MSHTLVTPTIIAKEALAAFENALVMGMLVNRQYKNEFGKKPGQAIEIRKPNFLSTTSGATIASDEDILEQSVTFTTATQRKAAFNFTSLELTLSIEDFSERYIIPAAQKLANDVDADLTSLYPYIGNSVGTPGTTPSGFSDLGDAQTILDELGVPSKGRCAVLHPTAHWKLADGLKGTFAATPANKIHTEGYLGTVANLDIHMDQNIKSHTCGVFAGTVLVDDTVADGDSIITLDAFTAATTSDAVLSGDVFTIASVYNVNPISKVSTGRLKQFSVLNDEATASNELNVDFDPDVGQMRSDATARQNMAALPVNNAGVTFKGTSGGGPYPQNLIFHKDAFGLVVYPLDAPLGKARNAWSRITENGFSIRVVFSYDHTNDKNRCRIDILYGVRALNPDMAIRLWG